MWEVPRSAGLGGNRMRYRRSAVAAVAFVIVVASPALTTASASVRGGYTWAEQTVFALGPTGNYVAEWMGTPQKWTVIGGPASHVYAGSAGVFATDPNTGDIFEYNGTPGSWTAIGGPGVQFVEGGGHLYGLGPNFAYVAEWNGTPGSWTIIGGAATGLYVGPYGLFATGPSMSSEDIWHYNGTPNSWADIGTPGDSIYSDSAIAVGSSAVYRIDTADSAGNTVVDEWSGGTTWTPILTVGGSDELSGLIAGNDGVYIADTTTNGERYLEYGGTPNTWSPITPLVPSSSATGMFPIAESATNLYGGTFELTRPEDFIDDIEVYSGTGTTWTVIGGPADPGLGAGD